METQAGAPPDDFTPIGQNWGFPTYNWKRMQQDGFAWWKQRFEQMSNYFDAFVLIISLVFFASGAYRQMRCKGSWDILYQAFLYIM
jgi:4-alpha-glucanotransferase